MTNAVITKSVQEQLVNPTSAMPITGGTATITGIGSILATIFILWLRRRLSRDSSQIVQDRADGITVKTLLEVNKSLATENERVKTEAREAWSYRTADARTIARLESDNTHLTQELERLRLLVQPVVTAARELEDSGMMPLVEHKPSKPKR